MNLYSEGNDCVCVCVCVCVLWCSGCVLRSGPEVLSSSPTQAIFHLPPTSPPSCDWGPGICWDANSRPFLMQQQWSRWDFGSTPFVVRKGLFFCDFLARLQELCLHGSQCLLSAQASWLCQVRVTASSCKIICLCLCVCVCVKLPVLG